MLKRETRSSLSAALGGMSSSFENRMMRTLIVCCVPLMMYRIPTTAAMALTCFLRGRSAMPKRMLASPKLELYRTVLMCSEKESNGVSAKKMLIMMKASAVFVSSGIFFFRAIQK